MWTFRDYQTDDLEAMFRLDEACFASPFRFSRGMMRRFAEAKRARVVLAEEGGTVVGFCIVHLEPAGGRGCAGYVVTVDVAEGFRRQGLAGELMRRGEDTARAAGCGEMLLHVFTGNDAAIRFYESRGYGRVLLVRGFYGADREGREIDAWLYRKPLAG